MLVCPNGADYRVHATTLSGGMRARGSLPTGASVFPTGEDGVLDYHRKVAAGRVEMGDTFNAEAIAGKIHVIDVSGIPGVRMVANEHGQYVVTIVPQVIAQLLERKAPNADLVIVETISRFGAGENNDAHGAMIDASEQLCKLRGCALMLNTHTSQAAARAGATDQFAT